MLLTFLNMGHAIGALEEGCGLMKVPCSSGALQPFQEVFTMI